MAKTLPDRSVAPSSGLSLPTVGQVFLCLLLVVGAAASQSRGVVHLRSEPGAEVVWEGVRLGRVGSDGRLSIRNVPSGEFSLRLSKAEHESVTVTVVVAKGQEKVVEIALAPSAKVNRAQRESRSVVDSARLEKEPRRATVAPEPTPSAPSLRAESRESPGQETSEDAAGEGLQMASTALQAPVASLSSTPVDLAPVLEVGRSGPSPILWFVVVLLLSLLAAATLLWRRGHWEGFLLSRSDEPGEVGEEDSWEPEEDASWQVRGPRNVGPREDPQELLSKIRRHEHDLEGTRPGESRIIDAEFVELAEDEST